MTDADAETLAALRTELAALRDRCERLEAELRGAHQRVDLTMRGRLRCPACGCRRIAHATSILDRGDADSREKLALYQPSWWSGKTVGEMEAYACTGCGALEWWVKDPGALCEHREFLRILDGEIPGDGPFR